MPTRYRQLLRRWGFGLLAASVSTAFFGAVAHHVITRDFKPLVAFCLPVLVVFFGFTSLLYVRGRSLGPTSDQLRTLFAAECAMQGALWYLTGIAAGASLYGLFAYAQADGWWLLLFALPCALMQVGLLLVMRATAVVAPQFLRSPGAYATWRRIRVQPA